MNEANHRHLQRLWSRVQDLADDFALMKMDYLTELGRKYLPQGYWGELEYNQPNHHKVCLTFDDGPDPHNTPWLLDLLEKEGVKATFFLVGSRMDRHPHLVEKIHLMGHTIANHSYNHLFMPFLTTGMIEKEIDSTSNIVESITGVKPVLFRPPYGVIDQRGADLLWERALIPVYWGSVPEDWHLPGARRVVRRVMRRFCHGSLIVLHEARLLRPQTLSAAKEIIFRGKAMGYRFVDLPELMMSGPTCPIEQQAPIPGEFPQLAGFQTPPG